MDFASYMGSLVIFCQVIAELVACFFPFSFCIGFGFVAMGLLFFVWLFFLSPVSFFCLPSAVENSDSSASVNDSVHKPLRSWTGMSCFLSLLKQLVGPSMHSA